LALAFSSKLITTKFEPLLPEVTKRTRASISAATNPGSTFSVAINGIAVVCGGQFWFEAFWFEGKFQISGYESVVTEERPKPECFKPELTAADYGCAIDVQLMCADRTTTVPLIATEKVLPLDL
jgi:hypothetical protein